MDDQPVFAFSNPTAQDPVLTGSKGANLARMTSCGLPIPAGFVVTTTVFNELAAPQVRELTGALTHVQGSEVDALQEASDSLTQSVREIRLPRDVALAIESAYDRLGRGAVSVRSSATAEDLDGASFAGQYATVLNATSVEAIISCLLEVWASLYSPHAIAYREKNSISHRTYGWQSSSKDCYIPRLPECSSPRTP